MLSGEQARLLRVSCTETFPRPTLNLLIRLLQRQIERRVARRVPRRTVCTTSKRRMESSIFSKWPIYMIALWRSCKVTCTRSRATCSRIMLTHYTNRGRKVKQISSRWLAWMLEGIKRIRRICSIIISFRSARCWRIRRGSKREC